MPTILGPPTAHNQAAEDRVEHPASCPTYTPTGLIHSDAEDFDHYTRQIMIYTGWPVSATPTQLTLTAFNCRTSPKLKQAD